jgi:hypothetical protein
MKKLNECPAEIYDLVVDRVTERAANISTSEMIDDLSNIDGYQSWSELFTISEDYDDGKYLTADVRIYYNVLTNYDAGGIWEPSYLEVVDIELDEYEILLIETESNTWTI